MFLATAVRFWFRRAPLLGLVFILFGASACEEEQPTGPTTARRTQQAFDLVTFLDQETKALSAQPAAVRKTVSEEGKPTETKTIATLHWGEELGAFADADINKPALTGAFTQETSNNAAGQQVHRYKAKDGANTNVQEVTYTVNAQGQLVQLSATMVQENMLFRTQKQLFLQAQPGATPSLQRYRLEETQKLLLMDAQHYGVAAEVVR
ncbi:hypothetical protein [Rufibacter immobilis]|uniref:hypothetical protein n=1 Tax=Rufibacter immobilis TaxID=1348778 RepID=UPI0035EFDD80